MTIFRLYFGCCDIFVSVYYTTECCTTHRVRNGHYATRAYFILLFNVHVLVHVCCICSAPTEIETSIGKHFFLFVLCSLRYKSLHVHDMAIISSCFHICLSMFDEGEWIAAMHCESNTYIIVCSAYLIPIYLLLRIFHLFCDFVCCHIMTMEFFPFVSHWANNKKSKYTESQFLFLFFGNSATWILMHSHGWQSSAGNTNRTLYVKWRICLCNVNYISAKKRLNVARPHLPAFKASNDYRQASSPGFTWCFFTRSTTSFHDVRPALAIFINICELLIFQLEIYSKMLIVNHG